jgi:hypothetical protein
MTSRCFLTSACQSGPSPLSSDVEHCTGCGRTRDDCNGCRRQLDPPRFCPHCGRRLRVLVSPTGYSALCKEHGDLDF